MGTQQMLLIIVGVIVVGIAIAVGLSLFNSTSAESNRDAIVNDMMNLSQYAYRYKLTPIPYGGGGRSYSGFTIPEKLSDNENASYASESGPNSVRFLGTSKYGYGTVAAVLDSAGELSAFTFSGQW
jgi:hypothetical protein